MLTETATVTVEVGVTEDGGNKGDTFGGTLGDDIYQGLNGEDILSGGMGHDSLSGDNDISSKFY